MPNKHKDLPSGSQAWANDMDALYEENKQLKEVVRRLCENAGLDYSNPQRGINSGATPSTANPVGQKLSSLADVQTYNVADKQLLGWSGKDQRWLPVTPTTSGVSWRKATDDELLQWDLTNDSSDTPTTPQVIGIVEPGGTSGTVDSYGLVGTGDAAAFLHAAGRFWGGTTRAHGYVGAEPYYTKMGVVWVDDTSGWDHWGEITIDRENIYLSTPKGGPSNMASNTGQVQRDGVIVLQTNWFYVPMVNGTGHPARPVPETGRTVEAGAMVYDMTLKKPLWWNGSAWADANGTTV